MSEMLIVAGQSNSLTRGVRGNKMLPARWPLAAPTTYFWDGGQFVLYNPALYDTFGPEVGYAIARYDAGERSPLYIVKYGMGNTQLSPIDEVGALTTVAQQWAIGDRPKFPVPDWHPSTNKGLFSVLKEMLNKACLDRFVYQHTFLWVQGEADAHAGEVSWEDYAKYLEDLVFTMELRFDIQVCISTLSPKYKDKIRQAQLKVCLGKRTRHLIVTDDYNYDPRDGIHLTRNSAMRLGKHAYAATKGE